MFHFFSVPPCTVPPEKSLDEKALLSKHSPTQSLGCAEEFIYTVFVLVFYCAYDLQVCSQSVKTHLYAVSESVRNCESAVTSVFSEW